MIYKIKHAISRFIFYRKRKVVLRYLFLKLNKGFSVISNNDSSKKIMIYSSKSIFEYPISDVSYEISVSPKNEILVDSYIKIKDGTFIDVGAFIGKYTVKIGKNKNVQTVAIEPNPISFNLLLNNLKLNNIQENVLTINKAISDNDNAELNFENNFAMTRVVLNGTDNVFKVKTITLNRIIEDYALKAPFLIKIDTEGYEWQIIKSLERKLIGDLPIELVIEILPDCEHKNDIIEFLNKYNFVHEKIDFTNYYFKKVI